MKKIPGRWLSSSSMLFLALLACISGAKPSETQVPTTAGATNAVSAAEIPSSPLPQHQSIPGELPSERSSHAGDYDSSVTATEHRAPDGDRFTFGRFERPFNANTMDVYYPYLDIEDSLFYQDSTWIFAVITLKGPDSNGKLAGTYGAEIDLDLDGGGDWLILVTQPATTEWSTNAVQVLFDANDDVGGSVTIDADANVSGDGYEKMIFDNGQGDDADLAWARISPLDGNTVQIAAKRSLLGGDDTFMTGMWAGGAGLDPALFDLNDHFTHEQAGAALADLNNFYPIKAVAELDNTCRMAIGFVPTGAEPGLCRVVVTPAEQEACPAPQLYCVNFGSQKVCYCLQP